MGMGQKYPIYFSQMISFLYLKHPKIKSLKLKRSLIYFVLSQGRRSTCRSPQFSSPATCMLLMLSSLADPWVPTTNDLCKYLVIPIVHRRMSKQSYAFVVDKVRKKLSGWKARTLSLAGRVTLAQSSIMSILGYVMQTSLIPIAVCDEVERLCRSFI